LCFNNFYSCKKLSQINAAWQHKISLSRFIHALSFDDMLYVYVNKNRVVKVLKMCRT